MNDTETQYCLYCPECSRWHDTRSGCEADIRLDERQKIQAEMAAQITLGDKARAREAILESSLASLLTSLAAYPTFPDSPLTLAMDRARKVLRGEQEGQEKRQEERVRAEYIEHPTSFNQPVIQAIGQAIAQATQSPVSALLPSGEYRRFDVQIEPDGIAVYTEPFRETIWSNPNITRVESWFSDGTLSFYRALRIHGIDGIDVPRYPFPCPFSYEFLERYIYG